MRYHQPYGIADANASFINGDPSQGRPGSIPDAGSIEYPQREIVNFIGISGYVPTDSDLYQLTQVSRAQRTNFAEDIGPVNALQIVMLPTLVGYTVGLPVRVRIAHTNTGTVTLDCGPGAKSCRRADGSVMLAGDLPAGMIASFVYDGTNFQLSNFTGIGGGGGGTTTYNVKIPFAVDTGTVNNIVANFTPAITTLTDGDMFLVRLSNAPNAATTLKVNALATHPVKTRDGSDLGPALVSVGEDLLFVWDSAPAQFRLIGVSAAAQTARFGNIAVFKTAFTGSWVVPAGVFQIYYQLWGAGGGGGGGVTLTGGSPGGGGGHVEGYLNVSPGQTLGVVIGQGGAAIGAGNPTGGGVGGSSAFAGIATALGGGGGGADNGFVNSSGGTPGGATGGQWSIQGVSGQSAILAGGNYPMGGGGWGGGQGGQNYGQYSIVNASGGAGGNSVFNSQAGAPGLLLIHY